MTNDSYRIVFLNQVTGPLFRELAEDVANEIGPCLLITGRDQQLQAMPNGNLNVEFAPKYDRSNLWRRLWTWNAYLAVTVARVFRTNRRAVLFIVSNPPFLGLVGWLVACLRGQRYVILVYDLYPGLLEGLGRIRRHGWLARVWTRFNRLVWSRAAVVFTIGDHMAANLRTMLSGLTAAPRVTVIPNWADEDFVKPVSKNGNWFAKRYGQVGKLTVMYSGNVGESHDLSPVLEAARTLEDDEQIHFVFIGGGARWKALQLQARELHNVVLLPLQPEEYLPFTLPTADVAVVTLEPGVEGFSVPSRTYYALAAGAALLVISRGPNELTDLIEREACGLAVEPGSAVAVADALRRFRDDPLFLSECRRNARAAMERHYSRRNTQQYAAVLSGLLSFPDVTRA